MRQLFITTRTLSFFSAENIALHLPLEDGATQECKLKAGQVQYFVRCGMCDGRYATLWLLPLWCAFPATGEIDGHVSPEPLGSGKCPHRGEMLGLKPFALCGGKL